MESEKMLTNQKNKTNQNELANLKRVAEVDNFTEKNFDDLVIKTAKHLINKKLFGIKYQRVF